MKKNEKENTVKEKIDALSPLDAGIVFGKEEAWDKLQARMDKKPAVRISLKYTMAAAAALLVLFIGLTVYYYPEKEIAVRQQPAPVKESVNDLAVMHAPEIQLAQPTQSTAKEFVPEVKNNARIIPGAGNRLKPVVIDNVLPPVVEPSKVTIAIVSTVMAEPVAVKPMKVVNIRDVETNSATPAVAASTSNQERVDFRKMHVFYITDVEKEEVEQKTMMRESRNSLVHNLLGRPVYRDYTANPEDYPQPHNVIKSIFNSQSIISSQN